MSQTQQVIGVVFVLTFIIAFGPMGTTALMQLYTSARDDFHLDSALSAKMRSPPASPDLLVDEMKNVADLAKQRPHRIVERSSGLMQDDGGANIVIEKVVAMDTEPQCLSHHEYAQILPNAADLETYPEIRMFVNHHNKSRYYVCVPCRSCPPGVRILSHCHKRRDTVCSTSCLNPDHIYNPVQHDCEFPPTNPPMIDSPETDDVEGIDDEVMTESTGGSTTDASLRNHITAITVAVISLNVLLTFVLVMFCTSTRLRKRSVWLPKRFESENGLDPQAGPSHVPMPEPAIHSNGFPPCQKTVESEFNVEIHAEQSEEGEEEEREEEEEEKEEEEEEAMTSVKDLQVFHQLLPDMDPFFLVMIGQFGPEGGKLSCEDSDVVLEIPPGAIPADRPRQTIIAKVCLQPDVTGPKLASSEEDIWLTPLVDFEAPGLDRFERAVTMRLPHYAVLRPGWTFRVHYTDPTAAIKTQPQGKTSKARGPHSKDKGDEDTPWFVTSQTDKSYQKLSTKDGVSFSVDEKYINVSTSHFSKYVCSGCHKAHPLQLEAIVYWKHQNLDNHEEVTLKTYIVEPITDFRRMVEMNEDSSPNHTGFYPLTISHKKKQKQSPQLEICVLEDIECDRRWRLYTFGGNLPPKRELHVQKIIRCCSSQVPPQETYLFRLNKESSDTGTAHAQSFQTIVTIAQVDNPQGITRILVNAPLNPTIGPHGLETNREGAVITDEQLERVVDKIPVRKVRPLYRKLMGDGANVSFDGIVERFPKDSREQTHEALVTWRQSKGRLATPESLCTALRAVDMVGVAEDVLKRAGIRSGHSSVPDICKVTNV